MALLVWPNLGQGSEISYTVLAMQAGIAIRRALLSNGNAGSEGCLSGYYDLL